MDDSHIGLGLHPTVIAHRGASALAPENTLSAFLKARELGLNWVEFDVRLAACGEVIVFHDDTLNRTTPASGSVQSIAYADLKQLDAGSWFAPQFARETIPTLRETLAFLNENDLAANIEIKVMKGFEHLIVERIFDILSHTKLDVPIFISSFSLDVLQWVRKYSSNVLLAYLMGQWHPDWQIVCDELKVFAVDAYHQILNQDYIDEIKASRRFLFAYTVNDPVRAEALFAMGVDGVFSDCPTEFISHFVVQDKKKG